ncbi:MAG TPA: CvpA family protein [Phycisphaerae bacterium]|nr:CvpA family protein [Phycisphaerae bacterium]
MYSVEPPPVVKRSRSAPKAPAKAEGASFEVEGKRKARFPVLTFGLLAGGAATGFYFSEQADYLLGQIASVVIGALGLHGLWRGAFRKLVMLPLTIVMVVLLAAKPDFADAAVQMIAGKSSPLGNLLACGLVMVVTFLVAGAFVRMARNRVILKRSFLTWADRTFGMGLGLAEGALTMLVLCWMSVLVEPQMLSLRMNENTAPGSIRHSVSTTLLEIARESDAGPLKSIVRDSNMLRDIPSVRAAIVQLEQMISSNGDFWNPNRAGAAVELLRKIDPKDRDALGGVVKQLQEKNNDRASTYRRMPAPGQ